MRRTTGRNNSFVISRMGRNKQFALLFQNGEGYGKKRNFLKSLQQMIRMTVSSVLSSLLWEREHLTLAWCNWTGLGDPFLGKTKRRTDISSMLLKLKKNPKGTIFDFDWVGMKQK